KPNEEKPKDSSLRAKLNKEKPKDESVRAKPNEKNSKGPLLNEKPNKEKPNHSSSHKSNSPSDYQTKKAIEKRTL
ncbi:hypothetical protein JOC83_003659, partial [Bacillus iocasae]